MFKALRESLAKALSTFKNKIAQLTTPKLSKEKFFEYFWELELALLEGNVALEAVSALKRAFEQEFVDKPIQPAKIEAQIRTRLKAALQEMLQPAFPFLEKVASASKPCTVCFFGINGVGKTLTIAKIAQLLLKSGYSVVAAAGDTWRAAAIEQLRKHAAALGIDVIAHSYGSDPAAVAFDAIRHAKAKSKDVVLIDTAGRMHTNINLMEQMAKIVRVAKPHLKVFVGEMIAGSDLLAQARQFDAAVGIDCAILAKADIDEKGGAALSFAFATGKQIAYLGTGQGYGDLEEFNPEKILARIGIDF